jgi:hypothetical protein
MSPDQELESELYQSAEGLRDWKVKIKSSTGVIKERVYRMKTGRRGRTYGEEG